MLLYKYRTIDNLEFFIDIILNQRLFASQYTDLNDPMEGYYTYTTGALSKEVLNTIKSEKERLGICSLSKNSEIALMWSHYADGHRGVVIGIEIDHNKYKIEPIKYKGLPTLHDSNTPNYKELAQLILTHKHNIWKYEEEIRIITRDNKFINVKIKNIILGKKMKYEKKEFIKSLVKKLDSSIDVLESNIYDI